MEWYLYPVVVAAGFVAGFINTLAGSGSLITLPVLIFTGLPANVANGTNRVAILLQNVVGASSFKRSGVLDVRGRAPQLTNPQYEIVRREDDEGAGSDEDGTVHTGRIVPVYEKTGTLTPKLQRTLVRRALEAPLRFIVENAGIDGSIVVDKVKHSKGNLGFNAQTEEYEDLMKAGVIDPTKVVRTALQNAASVAALLLTTEALVADKPAKKKGGAMPDMSGMGDMDDMM